MDKFKLVIVMLIWGSLGVMTKSLQMSAFNLAFLRAMIALPVLMIFLDYKEVKSIRMISILPYLVSGVLLGVGWLTLFYGFKNTNVAIAVIVYNMCPVYVLILAPIVLREKISLLDIGIILMAFAGLVLVVASGGLHGIQVKGILYSGISGIMYAFIAIVSLSYFEPLFGILLGFLLLGERMSVTQILGGMLILGGTFGGEVIKSRLILKRDIEEV